MYLIPILLIFSCKSHKVTQSGSNKVGNAFYKEIHATHYISPKYTFLEEDLIVELNSKGLILELVSKSEIPKYIQQKWNKYYYEDLPHHYLDKEVLQRGAEILNINKNNLVDIINNWPGELTEAQYSQLYKELKIDLVEEFEVLPTMEQKYIITPNKEYWDFTSQTDYPLLVDILSTYEREFEAFELVHDNLETALDYAIIIFDALFNHRGPDNPYYYNQLALDQFDLLSENLRNEFESLGLTRYKGLPNFGMDFYSKNKEKEYNKIIRNRRDDLDLSKRIFTNLPNPPFYIIKILN